MKLDIAFFGPSLVSAYRNDAVSYLRGIIRALALRGHRVTFYEPDLAERHRYRDLPDPGWAGVVLYSATDVADVERVLAETHHADVIIKASGVGVWDDLLEREIVRHPGDKIFWDLDAPVTVERMLATPEHPLRELVPRFDVIVTNGGGSRTGQAYALLGARFCTAVYAGVDPRTHFPVPRMDAWASDLALLVDRRRDRDERIDALFFETARALPDRHFLLGGSGWDGVALPANVRAVGHIACAARNVMNASAGAVLCVSSQSTAAHGFAPPAALFEAAAAGACVVTDAWPGLEVFFRPGREILVAQDGAHLARIVRELDPARARALGAAARRRVFENHTFAQRARLVEALLLRGRSVEAYA